MRATTRLSSPDRGGAPRRRREKDPGARVVDGDVACEGCCRARRRCDAASSASISASASATDGAGERPLSPARADDGIVAPRLDAVPGEPEVQHLLVPFLLPVLLHGEAEGLLAREARPGR